MPVLSGTRYTSFSKPLAFAAGMLALTSLSGCSLLDDRSEEYVNARDGRTLDLPETADQSRFGQAMPIRDISSADASKMYPSDIPRPPDMTSEILDENYVIEELDGRAWLLVNDVPGRLWPAVTAYMSDRGLGVSQDNPQIGLLQSELLNFSKRARELAELPDNPGAAEPRVVLQVRMAPGVRRKTSEIQVRKLVVSDQADELIPWNSTTAPTSDELELQKHVLADLGEFLKNREESKSFSRAASGMVSSPLVRLEADGDEPTSISMSLDFGRSWAEVNRALSEAGIPVVDLNRSAGWLYVDFRTADERESGWFGWFSDKEKPHHTHTLTLAEREDAIEITAQREDSYDGEQSAPDLLTQLFDYLY
ncbi:outer membrane protein assembly factor BamC [Marinobacter salinexigens]|uniref:Outer membrane protein assembly factor BamC n=1 Tax=Marinobacter salinexigens TaxID=2919747 RepID=A0A5B0VK04_9GAMM|nr:outer membrane protein assembly factor BamC [Marinobacter salinexigens]KAA1175017.1 outer membrane protein assembly factor BamC [Marinobacter salinexigens]